MTGIPNAKVDVSIEARLNLVYTRNIIADTLDGDKTKTIVVGSHLDSVAAGPGINDNGSGSSTNLELAVQLAKLAVPIKNRVRFCWWGAEELGLLGMQNALIFLIFSRFDFLCRFFEWNGRVE